MTRSRVLRVDLSEATLTYESVPDAWRRRYVGGKGLGARYLYDELSPGADPLGPTNLLGFLLGPLSGALPGESRYAAVTKSPLTGAFLDSYSGGTFPDRLAGSLPDCLGVLVTGAADEPVALVVGDGEPRLESAADLAGADTVETGETFPDAAVACVGPAGEREVAYATIASDAGDHHAGRGGAGAVMGSKHLKAVVAHGDAPPVPDALAALHDEYADAFAADDTGKWQSAGETLESVDFAAEVGVLPANGWRDTANEVDGIGIEAASAAAHGREHPDAEVPGGFRVDTPAGETVPRGAAPMTLGAGLGMDDFDAVAALGETCDRLGLDVITAGNAVAWAVRTGEVDFDFGDEAGASALIERVARRESDDDLADALTVPYEYALDPNSSVADAAEAMNQKYDWADYDMDFYGQYDNPQPDAPTGRGRARGVVWSFLDTTPVHREPIESPRPDLVEQWPSNGQQRNFYRLDQNNSVTQEESMQRLQDAGAFDEQSGNGEWTILTSGRQVEHQGGGSETRSNKHTADLQPHMYVEIHPDMAERLDVDGGDLVVASTTDRGSILLKARVTHRPNDSETFFPFHWGGMFKGESLEDRYPDGTVPYAIGDSVNAITSRGYDVETQMQETKASMVRIQKATPSVVEELSMRPVEEDGLSENVVDIESYEFPQDRDGFGRQKDFDVRENSTVQ